MSLRDVLAGLGSGSLPLVRAATQGVARAALVAAKQVHSALGLALPAGVPPEAWFSAVVREADELAPRLPLLLSAEVAAEGGSDADLQRSGTEAWRLVESGVTHLTVDVQAVPAGRRAEAVQRLAEPALERELGLDLVLPREGTSPGPGAAAALLEELFERGVSPDLASGRWPLPRNDAEVEAQIRQLIDLCGWIEPVPVLRRGLVTPALLAGLSGTPVRICEDGGAAHAAARRALGLPPDGEEAPQLARESRELPPEIGDRPEAMAYVETITFLEALGAPGSAGRILGELERRLAEG